MIPTALSAQSEALLLTPALLFVVPSFRVSRPQGISRVQARRITVAFIGTVRRPKNRVDDRFNGSKDRKAPPSRHLISAGTRSPVMRPSSDISMSFRPGETERFCFVARASAGNNNIVAPIIAAMVPTSQLHWDVRLPNLPPPPASRLQGPGP
jgi:hypothetical protein